MEKLRYKYFSYEITTDPSFMDEQNAMTPELRRVQENLFIEINNNPSDKTIKKLLNLIEKFPDNPQLKNYLSVAYVNSGQVDKAREVNHWLESEHPWYLFGKLNRAAEYYEKGEFEKMPEILGEDIELQSLYPDRKLFHLIEVTAFYKIAILYFLATGNVEAAESRIKIMKDIAPDHPDTDFVTKQLFRFNMEKAMERFKEEEKDRISITPLFNIDALQTTEKPVFNNDLINILYKNGLYISKKQLDDVLSVPRESLIADLESVLNDAVVRYWYYEKKAEGVWDEDNSQFVLHAIMLLGELRAEKSLLKVLNILRGNNDFLDFWFGDHITATLWEPLYYLGNRQLKVLKDFVKEPGIDTYTKVAVSDAVCQVYYHQPKRKQEVESWFSDVFDFFSNCTTDENIIDSEVIGLMVADVVDLKLNSLLPVIKTLFDKKYVSVRVMGDYRVVEKEMPRSKSYNHRKELLPVYDRYQDIVTSWAGYTEENEDDDDDDDGYTPIDYVEPVAEPVRVTPKIGRNDPCPCGSGKKYKKCCMNKK